jgi:flagellar biogenesis protein FliO
MDGLVFSHLSEMQIAISLADFLLLVMMSGWLLRRIAGVEHPISRMDMATIICFIFFL